MTDDAGYVVAVADSLSFALGREWSRLSARDPRVSGDRVRATLAELAGLGVDASFGDGELPVVPDAATSAVAVLREQLAYIRAIAPEVFASGADTWWRILCTDPWPRIYTPAVLDFPATSPVHVMQASDLSARLDQWARVGQLARFTELRAIIAFGSPLDRMRWPLDLGNFRDLRMLDLSTSWMNALPPSIGDARALESLDLSVNPIGIGALAPLSALSGLRHLNLRGTGVRASELPRLGLPASCQIELDEGM